MLVGTKKNVGFQVYFYKLVLKLFLDAIFADRIHGLVCWRVWDSRCRRMEKGNVLRNQKELSCPSTRIPWWMGRWGLGIESSWGLYQMPLKWSWSHLHLLISSSIGPPKSKSIKEGMKWKWSKHLIVLLFIAWLMLVK